MNIRLIQREYLLLSLSGQKWEGSFGAKRCFRILTLAMLFLPAQITRGQQLGQFVENSQQIQIPFTITNYNTKHGLPQNQITDILTKRNGELILSTANGIVSYDGYSFSNFIRNCEYKKLLHTKLIYSEKYKKLYGLELAGGFNQIDPTYRKINDFLSACLYNDKIYGILRNGTICVFDPKDNTTQTVLKTGINQPRAINFNGKRFIIGSKDGVYLIDFKTKKTTPIKGLQVEYIKKNPFNDDIYFLGTNKAYKLLKNNQVQRLIPEINTTDFVFHDMTFTPNDEVYIGTSKGLIYTGYGYSELFDETTFLPSENIRSLCYNRTENCIFAGTTNKGLLKLHLKNCASLMHFSDLSNASAGSIIITSFGKILVCASDGIVYSISVDEAKPYLKPPDQPASISEVNGEIWVGTWGEGVFRYKGQKLVGQITSPQLNDQVVHSIFKDSRGTIWVGTTYGLSAGKTPETIKPVLSKEVRNQIITMYEKKNGHLLLGGNNGMDELDENHKLVSHWGEKEGLVCKEIRAFYEDKFHKVWIGTYDGGLYCLDNGKLTSINAMKNCMLKADIFTLAKDLSGNIYMTSNNGLWVVNERQLNDFYYHKTSYLIPFIYANESGIMNSEFNGGFQNNYARSKHNHFYFPSIEGAVVVRPEEFVFRRKLVPEIKWIRINNKLISQNQTTFERDTRTIKFNFYVANFSSKFNVYYQYQLEGPNTSNRWEQMQKSGNVSLSFLPPGEYTIRVRALDASNDPNPRIISYHFTIKPYYYETWWFKTFIALIILSGISLVIRNRIANRRQKELRENTINNNILELKLKAIQSKMNPHFIFNTLNNIQYLIVLNRKEAAEHALTEFSLLLRKFLQQSDHSFVRLKDEMDIVEKYLLFEQISFDGELEIAISLQESCGNRIIPTLLLQPVVENAVKHGLAHSKQQKRISIYATCTPEMLSLSIEDYGIGREASKGINSSRENHVSHGWKLIKDKIDMIHQKYGVEITYEITDKLLPETGTIVTFQIPLIDEDLLNY